MRGGRQSRALLIILLVSLLCFTLPAIALADTHPSFSAGGTHSLAIDNQGRLWAWGYNTSGQLGKGTTVAGLSNWAPVQIGDESNWTAVSAGLAHSLAINIKGELYSWGYNSNGILGKGHSLTEISNSSPVRVGLDSNWTQISAGNDHSLALNSKGEMFAWGGNGSGKLGKGASSMGPENYVPVQIGVDQTWATISAGQGHSLAINSKGELFAWGWNSSNQLGINSSTNVFTPTKVSERTDWVDVAAGYNHSLALTRDGKLYAFGNNDNGQLGKGDKNPAPLNSPVQIAADIGWQSISAGDSFTLSANGVGKLFSWGNNDAGKLGRNSGADVASNFSPELITVLESVAGISAGEVHALGLTESGKLYAWGGNNNGQLGTGDSTSRLAPVQIGAVNTWGGPTIRVITFNSQGGTAAAATRHIDGRAHGVLPTPTRAGHTFVGWFTTAAGGSQFSPQSVVNASQTLHARWRSTVNFNAAGGTAVAARVVTSNTAVGALPATSRAGHTFAGWFTPNGAQASAATIINGHTTLTARWVAVPAPVPAKSNNNRLSGLKLNRGKLTQKYSASRATHTVRLTRAQTQVRITPTRAHGKARTQVLVGKTWRNVTSHNAKVARGKTATVRFRVIAENGAIRNHTVRVQRAR